MELGEIIKAEKINKKAEKEAENGKYDDFVIDKANEVKEWKKQNQQI